MINAAIITVSDTRRPKNDASGDKLRELLKDFGAEIDGSTIVKDDQIEIETALEILSRGGEINLILTTGGTGLGPRDNTPEATLAVIEREAPGIAEAMRRETAVTSPFAMLSRGVCGIRRRTLIINFPGSPKAVEECFEVIRPVLKHAVDLIGGKTEH